MSRALNQLRNPASVSVSIGLFVLLVVIGITYLGFKGWASRNIAFTTVFAISSIMLVMSLVFSRFAVFSLERNFVESAMAWFVGFVPFLFIGNLGNKNSLFSLLSLSQSQLLSSLSGELPAQWLWFLNRVVNSINEELFWGIGLPMFLISLMNGLGRVPQLRLLRHPFVQMVVLLVTLPLSFLVFHVREFAFVFIAAAISFRALMTVAFWGDLKFNLVPRYVVLPSFLIGAHMGNNIGDFGVRRSLDIIFGYPIGWLSGFVLFLFISVAVLNILGTFRRWVL